jgi:hypothetical protein
VPWVAIPIINIDTDPPIALLIITGLMSFFLLYTAICFLLNSTQITLGRQHLEIKSAPLPYWTYVYLRPNAIKTIVTKEEKYKAAR